MIPQPYYVIDFVFITGLFEVRVNDIPVIMLSLDKQQMSTEVPINHGIHQSGPFEVSVKLLPVPGETQLSQEAALRYKVYLYDVSNGFKFQEDLGGWKSPKVDKENPEALFTNSKFFEAEVPYSVNALWTDGKQITKVKEAREKLIHKYSEISRLLKNGKYDTYQNMISVREQNIAKAMYLTPSESQARFRRLKRDLQSGFDKVEFPKESVVLVPSAYGKKASLRRPNGDPALSFVNPELGEQQMLDIEFYFDKKEKQFKII